MRTRVLVLFCLAVCACGDDEPSAPLVPNGDGSHMVGGNKRDGGQNVDDEDAGRNPDAGPSDGPGPGECRRIDALRMNVDESPVVTSTELPRDFLVTRQAATWRDNCEHLVIELSNGLCPNGQGHELEVELATSAILDGRIAFGLNFIESEPMAVPGIRVRYARPSRFPPEGIYGTCEGASGTMTFMDAPDVTRAMNLRATYDLVLPPCDGRSNVPQIARGYFDVRVLRTMAMACP